MANDVADGINEVWASEEIPDQDTLFMRIHRVFFNVTTGKPKPVAFRNLPRNVPGSGMSTDWEKYSTPTETQERANKPSENAVIAMNVGKVRGLPGQTVVHTPNRELNNRAHTDVFGDKTEEVRLKCLEIYEMVISLQ